MAKSGKSSPALPPKKVKPSSKKQIKPVLPNFTGTYSTTLNGTLISITLSSKGNSVSGNFLMNGQQAKINGLIKNLSCTGKIVEDHTLKSYDFEASKNGENLNFKFVVPEQNNQTVHLVLKKENASKSNTLAAGKNRNSMLLGTWRYTEVISSGSGQFYSSFSTDYFIKFSSDGTAQIWTGKSAGGTNGVTIDSAKPGTVQQVEWYTEGKLLYLVQPNTKQKSAVTYYAETNRMLLTSGSSKKVYQKISS